MNNKFSKIMADDKSVLENTGKLIEITPDNKIIIDPQKFMEMSNKIFEFWAENGSVIIASADIALFGVSSMMIWKAATKAYDKGNFVDYSQFKSDRARLRALKMVQRNRMKFFTSGALLVLAGVQSMFYLYKFYKPNTLHVNVNNTPSPNKTATSIMPFFTYFKNSKKWVKILS